jgi:hypothetical protein
MMGRTLGFRVLMSLLAIALVAGILGPASARAQTQSPPRGLGGERFENPTTFLVTNAVCNPEGTSTFNFQVSGDATGDYAGPFTESATVTLSPLTSNFTFNIVSLTANFTINSPAGQVTGSKQFIAIAGSNPDTGSCLDRFEGPPTTTASTSDLRFTATIDLPDGRTCTAVGSASISLIKNSSVLVDSFRESFTNDVVDGSTVLPTCVGGEEPPPPPPPVPTSKAQCEGEGYVAFGFKNQGDCTAFVERGPKKPKGDDSAAQRDGKGKARDNQKSQKNHKAEQDEKGEKNHKGEKGKATKNAKRR